MSGTRVFTVQVVVTVNEEAYSYDNRLPLPLDAEAVGRVQDDLTEWAQAMLDGPATPRTPKWQGIARVIAGSVDGRCRWFAYCHDGATYVAEHPIMGPIPVCWQHKAFADR